MRCYDALLYPGKPDLGIEKLSVVYHFQAREYTEAEHDAFIANNRGTLTCFDQEAYHRSLDPMYERNGWDEKGNHDKAKRWFVDFMSRLRSRPGGPSLRLGFYGIPVGTVFEHPFRQPQHKRQDISTIKYSRDDAKRFRDTGITDLVDVLFPSLYVWKHDWREHLKLAVETCELCAEIFERPICPFVWGEYHSFAGHPPGASLPNEWAVAFAKALKPMVEDRRIEALVLWSDYSKPWADQFWVNHLIEA